MQNNYTTFKFIVMNKFSIVFLSILMLSVSQCFSQVYMNDILDKTCNCVNNIKDTTNAKEYQMSLGGCLLNSSMPYKKEIKKDYLIDLDKFEEDVPKLGQIIGLKMATYCPKVMSKLTNMFKEDKVKNQTFNIKGVISKIDNELFVIITLTEENGKLTKFYWLTMLDSKKDLMHEYKTLIGKNVEMTFKKEEFFDPKIDEYRIYNVIKSIDF